MMLNYARDPTATAVDLAEDVMPALSKSAGDLRRRRCGFVDDYLRWATIVVVAILGIVLSIRRPPVLDLSQQLEQGTLLAAHLSGERSDLRFHPVGPNRLGTALAAAAAVLSPAGLAPRIAVAGLALLWCASIFWIAVASSRHPASATLACLFLFSGPFYAGFFNFISGMAGLAFWSWELARPPERRSFASLAVFSALGAALLYTCHALWFAFGAASVATYVLLRRFSWHEVAARAAGSLPIAVAAWLWRETLTQGGWQSVLGMRLPPLERLGSLNEAATLFLGGLHGPWEKLFLGLVAIWLLLALLPRRGSGSAGFDPFLTISAGLAMLCALLLPDRVDRTVMFAWRWGPIAGALLLLAFPAPGLRRAARGAFVAVASVALLLPTWTSWRAFQSDEMAGFEDALAAVPEGSVVAGLDYLRSSPRFKVEPYFQMFAYASVERGARINFSFAEVASSMMRFRGEEKVAPWTGQLEIYPRQFAAADLAQFDYLLVHATAANAITLDHGLGVVSFARRSMRWQLLKVDRARASMLFQRP